MKKEILQNNKDFYEVKYIISKKKYAIYTINKIYNTKSLVFYKNKLYHKNCNLGPAYKDKYTVVYRENNKFHNLYGYAYIDKYNNKKKYLINFIIYNKKQFLKYVSIYDKLSYKRIY